MGMFDNYTNNNNIPCNIFEYVKVPENHYIVEGGTCYNTFKILFKYDASAKISVTYYQAERLTFTKTNVEIIQLDDSFIVKCDLTKKETSKLGNTNLDTFAQVKIELGDKTIFGEKVKFNVIETIEEK